MKILRVLALVYVAIITIGVTMSWERVRSKTQMYVNMVLLILGLTTFFYICMGG